MMNVKRKYMFIIVLILLVSVFAVTFAYFGINIVGGPNNSEVIRTGSLDLVLSDSTLNVSVESPIYDSEYETQAIKKTFSITNDSDSLSICSSMYINITSMASELKNEYLKYRLVSSDGEVIRNGDFNPANDSDKLLILNNMYMTSGASKTFDLYIWLSYVDTGNQVEMLGKSLSSKIQAVGVYTATENKCRATIAEETNVKHNALFMKMLEDNTAYADNVSSPNVSASTGIDFGAISSSTNGQGLYYTTSEDDTQDGSIVYYYRGDVDNNHVIFAGFCFRIVRTNEDGSVRVRYNGTPTNGVCSQKGSLVNTLASVYNSSYNDNRYVGYMYGSSCTDYETCHANIANSTIKVEVDNWYQVNIGSSSTNNSKIGMSTFCNDRSVSSGTGINDSQTYYGAYARNTNGTPTYKCSQPNDMFELKSGLLTMDEVMYAGASASENSQNFYLHMGNNYWLMSPSNYNGEYSRLFAFYSDGAFHHDNVNSISSSVIMPVISLNSNINVTDGNGLYNNPYIVE